MTNHIYLEHGSVEEDLAAQLPSFMPKDPDSGNYGLLATVAERIAAAKDDIETVDKAKTVRTATSIPQLERMALLVDVKPKTSEGLEQYRARVLAEYQSLTSQGTVDDLLTGAAAILDIDPTQIEYTEDHTTVAGDVQLTVPKSSLSSLSFSEAEFAEIVEELIPASYAVTNLVEGTFTYITPDDYSGGNHASELGYDGLDVNGDPTDSGGTYAGIIG